MAKFDWSSFLDQHGIRYSIGSPHGRGILGIRCPFCGNAGTDPSRHRMGIHPEKGWRCLRDETHSGKSPVRLVAALIGCSHDDARRICGLDDVEPSPMSIGAIEKAMRGVFETKPEPPSKREPLIFPDEIRRLDVATHRERRIFMPYLEKRGYARHEAEEIVALYGLRAAMAGAFAYRLIFPIETPAGLATWTGRTINDKIVPRYKSLSTDPEKCKKEHLPVAAANIKQCIWNEHELSEAEGDLLLVCEGPFDALRVDYFGRRIGMRATCLFSKSLSKRQALLLSSVGNFTRRALLLDEDAIIDSFLQSIGADFAGIGVVRMPAKVKDPALLHADDIMRLTR